LLGVFGALKGHDCSSINTADVYKEMARLCFGYNNLSQVTENDREKAKAVSLGIIYGIGAEAVATRLSLSVQQAKDLMKAWNTKFLTAKNWMDRTVSSATAKLYVNSLMNRRRLLPEIRSHNYTLRSRSQRQAVNSVIQGTAADMMKLAMIDLYTQLKPYDCTMLMQIHDELVLQVKAEQFSQVAAIVADCMSNSFIYQGTNLTPVPFPINIKRGPNLGQLTSFQLNNICTASSAAQNDFNVDSNNFNINSPFQPNRATFRHFKR
jgi:DNA polymerase I-like protein with 3'-5' exonuclease and polymerase domains